jgi:hypothetical protein
MFFHLKTKFIIQTFIRHEVYEVCSESNAPYELTSIRIITGARLFHDFLRPPRRGSGLSFVVVNLPPKGGGRPIFGDSLGDPLQVLLQAVLGQRKVCRLRFHLFETEKCPL